MQRRTRLLLWLWRVLPLPRWSRRLYLRLTCATPLLGVSAVILDERGRVLLLRHSYRRDHQWGLPGGYLQKGEPPIAGLRREVREETGLEVEAAELLAAELYQADELDLAYRCRVLGGHIRLSPEASRAEYRRLDGPLDDVLPNQRLLLARAGLIPAVAD